MKFNHLNRLRAEADRLRAQIETMEAAENLSTEAGADLERAWARLEEIAPELEQATRRQGAAAAVLAALAAPTMGALPATFAGAAVPDVLRSGAPAPTAAEWLVADFAANGLGDQGAADRLRSWSEDLFRAPAQQALADNAGVVPTPLIGDLIKFVDAERRLVNALGVRPMWTGTGSRPRVTQNTQIGAQASEFTELSTRKMLITKDAMTRGTYGGYVEISEQDEEFTDPAMLQIILQDLAEQYGIQTDTVVAAALVSAATNTVEMTGAAGAISGVTSPGAWTAAFAAAAVAVFTNSKRLPTHMMVSADVWGTHIGLVDATGRPVYPQLNPQNAAGAMPNGVISFDVGGNGPAGLRYLVDPNFAANTCIIGDASRAEVYEMQKGIARSAFKVGTLSTEVGYRGYLGTYMRAEGFARLVNAA